jgi:hypothetical protein
MKNLFAHADKSKYLCIRECCIDIEEFSYIINVVSKVLKYIEMNSRCSTDLRLHNKLGIIKNLSINIVGRSIALLNIINSSRLTEEFEANINTLCNLVNGVVELRNQIREILEDSSSACCTIIKDHFEDVALYIDYFGLKLLIIALNLIKNYSNIPSIYSGKIASSLASLLFASLLNIHNPNVKKALKECFAEPN